MNLFRIILKQLRQRALSTVLTILSVALGVGLATAILIIQREGDKLFGQSEYGFDVIVGAKGSKLNLVLNVVYQVADAQGTVPYRSYTDLTTRLRREVKWVLPTASGDNYKGYRLIATQPKIIETPELAKVRSDVEQQFTVARVALQSLKKKPLPIAPNAPELPKLFAVKQQLPVLATRAEPFDPEARRSLESGADELETLLDELSSATDRAVIDKQLDRVEDLIGQGHTLVRGPVEVLPGKDDAPGTPFKLAQGKPFEYDRFQAVLGSEVAQKLNMKLGDKLAAEHGTAETPGGDHHEEEWEVTGILAPTGTAFDRVILIPLMSFYAIPEHDKALQEMAQVTAEYEGNDAPSTSVPTTAPTTAPSTTTAPAEDGDHDHEHEHHYRLLDGRIELSLPEDKWKLTAILARSRGGQSVLSLVNNYRNTPDAMAVNPASEMREFFATVLKGSSMVLLLLAILVSVVAAVSILVSIYNSIASRRREIAILRALGATRARILTLICLEAGTIGLIGSSIGVLMGMGLAGVASLLLAGKLGQGLNWASLNVNELLYFVAAIMLSVVAGLVPALKAYATPVADHLVGE